MQHLTPGRSLVVVIPGNPQAQQRPKIVKRGGFSGLADRPESVSWKGAAQVHMRLAMRETLGSDQPLEGPLAVEILCVFACPTSRHRKVAPRLREWSVGRQDVDNLAKCSLDAGNGVLWSDDRVVAKLTVSKIVGQQNEPPAVYLRVSVLEPASVPTSFAAGCESAQLTPEGTAGAAGRERLGEVGGG